MNTSIFTSVINGYLPEPHASLLNGILFGVNLQTTKNFYEQLKIVGLLHIVVLSGTNITLLAILIGEITRFLGKRISIMLTILIIILFIMFVGPQAPIIRAGIMGILTLVAILYGRKNFVLYSLFISFICICIFWPKWITTISLYLPYGATLGIILFGTAPVKHTKKIVPIIQQFLKRELKTSLAAQIFTAPIIFIFFKQISFISPISNILVSFIIFPLMIFGFLTVFLGKIHYVLGLLPSYICYGLLSYMIYVIDILSHLPFASLKF